MTTKTSVLICLFLFLNGGLSSALFSQVTSIEDTLTDATEKLVAELGGQQIDQIRISIGEIDLVDSTVLKIRIR